MERTSEMRPENDASVGGLRDDIKALSVLKLCTFLWMVYIVSAEAWYSFQVMRIDTK